MIVAAWIGSAATLPALACGSGERLYRDNFEWVDASWQLNPARSRIESGAMTLTLGAKQDYQANNESGHYGDVNVCVEVNVESGSLEAAHAALIFWLDGANFHGVAMGNGQVAVARVVNQEALFPAAYRPVNELIGKNGHWNTVELQTRERSITVLVNGVRILTTNGAPPPKGGKLALAAINGGDGTIAVKFRNFVVERGVGAASPAKAPAPAPAPAKAPPPEPGAGIFRPSGR
jgi:hypothetical protein